MFSSSRRKDKDSSFSSSHTLSPLDLAQRERKREQKEQKEKDLERSDSLKNATSWKKLTKRIRSIKDGGKVHKRFTVHVGNVVKGEDKFIIEPASGYLLRDTLKIICQSYGLPENSYGVCTEDGAVIGNDVLMDSLSVTDLVLHRSSSLQNLPQLVVESRERTGSEGSTKSERSSSRPSPVDLKAAGFTTKIQAEREFLFTDAEDTRKLYSFLANDRYLMYCAIPVNPNGEPLEGAKKNYEILDATANISVHDLRNTVDSRLFQMRTSQGNMILKAQTNKDKRTWFNMIEYYNRNQRPVVTQDPSPAPASVQQDNQSIAESQKDSDAEQRTKRQKERDQERIIRRQELLSSEAKVAGRRAEMERKVAQLNQLAMQMQEIELASSHMLQDIADESEACENYRLSLAELSHKNAEMAARLQQLLQKSSESAAYINQQRTQIAQLSEEVALVRNVANFAQLTIRLSKVSIISLVVLFIALFLYHRIISFFL